MYKIVLEYDPKLWQKLPNGGRYPARILKAEGEVPPYKILLAILNLAINEVEGSQPNLESGDKQDGSDTASKTEA